MKCSTRKALTLAAALAVAASLLTTSTGLAQQAERQRTATQPTSTATPKQQKEASKKAAAAARVFDQIMNAPDNSIPKDLLSRAEAVAVFPGMLKAGFVVGGRGGSGLISRRVTGGGGRPAHFTLGGAGGGVEHGGGKTG